MKLQKYTFRTPLFGSIDCEGVLNDQFDERIELCPTQMTYLYNEGERLLLFLTEHGEDLAAHVPEELRDVVVRAEFGECALLDDEMYLRTHIWAVEELDDEQLYSVKYWIEGQMSDGWGESLEQVAWKTKKVEKPFLYFDEFTMDFEQDTETCVVSYYAHPWGPYEFEIYDEGCEEVEEDMSYEIAALVTIPCHNRQVMKFPNLLALKLFLKSINRYDFLDEIEKGSSEAPSAVYLVRDLDGNSGIELLPMWTYEFSTYAILHDKRVEDDAWSYKMDIKHAIMEMLK